MPYSSGRHFLQIPGPTIDHRGPEFKALGMEVLEGVKTVFNTTEPVIIFASSGTGAWEAGLVNTLSPGDKVLMFETGHFATLWKNMAIRLGLEVDFVSGDWRRGVDPAAVEAKLSEDKGHHIKSVNVVHNETSTGALSRIAEIRKAMDRAGHPALLMVDTISSLGSVDYRHDEWGVDVTLGCSQKGLMLPQNDVQQDPQSQDIRYLEAVQAGAHGIDSDGGLCSDHPSGRYLCRIHLVHRRVHAYGSGVQLAENGCGKCRRQSGSVLDV
jgi:alanine-glyoxylate transaminase/serine-glyoxylate transaminase/serine-pyruvate transaminase